MKKTFYQLGISNIFGDIELILFSAGLLWLTRKLVLVIIECLSDLSWISLLRIIGCGLVSSFCTIGVLLSIRAIIAKAHNRVIYSEHCFYITGDLYNEEIAEQCKDEIEIREIKAVKHLITHRNSKKKGYTSTPLVFYEFTLLDGSKKRMLISYFSRIQRKKILAIINEETGSNFSYKTLPKADYSMNKKRKKKKKDK